MAGREVDLQIFADIVEATIKSIKIEIEYKPLAKWLLNTVISPIRIVRYRDNWYVLNPN